MKASNDGFAEAVTLLMIHRNTCFVGLDSTTDRCNEIIDEYDAKTGGQISYDDFCDLCDKMTAVPLEQTTYLSPKRQSELKEIFLLFESEKKDLMLISDLGMAIKCLGIKPTENELKSLIKLEGKIFEEIKIRKNYFTLHVFQTFKAI